MLESQRRQNWLFGGDSLYYSFFGRNIPFADMSFQGIEVVNVNPHCVGVNVQKLFLEGKLL
jgi:ketol-acid reductoisomerase